MCIYHNDCGVVQYKAHSCLDLIGWSHDSKISCSVMPNKSRPGALKKQPTTDK